MLERKESLMSRNQMIGWGVGSSLTALITSIPILMQDYTAVGLVMLFIGLFGSTILPLFIELEIAAVPIVTWRPQETSGDLTAEARIIQVEDASGQVTTLAHLRRWP